jgi:O-antigen/teichoic acid export membrane protein
MVLGADALQLPSALVLGIYLGRRLGAEGLGLYLLATSLVGWVELVVSSLFSRATVQLVAETRDWRPVASLVLRWHLAVSLAFFGALWLVVAPFSSRIGGELATCLLLLSWEFPLFGLARSHGHVLVGLGRFREKAWTSAARWSSRLVLAIGFVELGLGVRGAILGAVASTAVELAASRWFVRPSLRLASPAGLRRKLFDYSWPLFLHGVSLQLFHRLGLLLLVPLGGTLASAGVYGAADSLLRLRRVLGQSLAPLLLSTLSRLGRDGEHEATVRLSRNAVRFVLFTSVPIAVIAGAATPIMSWLFTPTFASGGPILAVLILNAPPFLLISVATAVFTASGRPRAPVALTAPMVPVALVGYLFAIPRWGGLGAAWVTTLTIACAGLGCLVALARYCAVPVPAATAVRAAAIGAAAFAAARVLPVEGWWLLLELPALATAGAALFLAMGEVGPEERSWLARESRAFLARWRSPRMAADEPAGPEPAGRETLAAPRSPGRE